MACPKVGQEAGKIACIEGKTSHYPHTTHSSLIRYKKKSRMQRDEKRNGKRKKMNCAMGKGKKKNWQKNRAQVSVQPVGTI
jgi:hypothetical protein